MKKKLIMELFTFSMLVSGMVGITGCGSTEEIAQTEREAQITAAVADISASHTVTYYDSDGKTVLNTVEIADGETLEETDGEKDGSTFIGWFATPNMTHRFDFSEPIVEDTSLFAGFVSYTEDTRSFAILGSGKSPVLLESNWGATIGEAQMLSKEESTEANVYSITLDLQEGDQFQFAINSSWENQRGYGYLTTIEQDGTEYFKNAGGLGETGVKRANIEVAIAGNYTFTLTTYPAEDIYETDNANYTEERKENFNLNPYDTIEWTYNGEATESAEESQTDYYIKGAAITDWKDDYSDAYKFTEKNGIYSLEITLTEGDEFMFTSLITSGDTESVGNEYIRYSNIAADDTESLSYVTGTESQNLIANEVGTYIFTYNPATQVLTVSMP